MLLTSHGSSDPAALFLSFNLNWRLCNVYWKSIDPSFVIIARSQGGRRDAEIGTTGGVAAEQPWLWIVLLDLIWLFLLWPLLDFPQYLYPFLPENWYDLWEEFAAFRLYGFLAVGWGFLMLSSLAITVWALFSGNARGWRQAGIVFGCICLVLFTFIAGMPPLGRATERARRISCRSNLKQIVLALSWYADENGGAYPPDLRTLSDTGVLSDEAIYRCPSRWRPNPEWSDYEYFEQGHRSDEAPFLILRDLAGNHPGAYRNLIYSDQTVSSGRGEKQ